MTELHETLRYSRRDEWVRKESDGTFTVGITDHAQEQLGDIVFVELPDINSQVEASNEVATMESVKTAASVYSPLTGKVVEVNKSLQVDPGLINRDPYGDGWLYRMKSNNETQFSELLNSSDYRTLTQEK